MPLLFVGNTVLAIVKTVIGTIGNSAGLIADGAHSATDAFSSAILYLGIMYAEKPADEAHPYGHRNFEFILAKIISILLLLVGIYLLFSSVYKLYLGHFETPDIVTLGTAIFSVVANGIMYRYGTCVGTQVNSPAILTNALENKADAMSSLAIAVGIVGAEMGYPVLDPVAACLVSLLIIRSAIHMLMESMDGLMDASIDAREKQKLFNIMKRNPDVQSVEFLRTRKTGRFISIEAGITLDADKTVEEGNVVIRDIRGDMINLVDNVKDVEISISSASPVRDEDCADGDFFDYEPA